jgi:hypothetical protein
MLRRELQFTTIENPAPSQLFGLSITTAYRGCVKMHVIKIRHTNEVKQSAYFQ